MTEEVDACIREELVPASHGCPEGFKEHGGPSGISCSTTVTTPTKLSCPVEHELVFGECLTETRRDPSFACPDGFYEDLSNKRCFAEVVKPKTPVCPAKYNLSGRKCLQEQFTGLLPMCPKGFKLSEDRVPGLECVKETKAESLLICPQGYRLIGDQCIAKKLQYKFDEPVAEVDEPEEEALLPLEVKTTSTTTAPEPVISVVVQRPVVQKGLVTRMQPITISGPASQVAAQQKAIEAGAPIPPQYQE